MRANDRAALDRLGLTGNTLVIFSSDNGPRSEPAGYQTKTVDFFDSNGELRGYKRDLYEGGIRVPMIAHWPGHVPRGRTSEALWSFADVMPTFAELAGATCPERTDGISVVEALLDPEKRDDDRFLYWEFYEGGFKQAVRRGKWKAIRFGWEGPLLLFDMIEDIREADDVAKDHPVPPQNHGCERPRRSDPGNPNPGSGRATSVDGARRIQRSFRGGVQMPGPSMEDRDSWRERGSG